MERKRIGILICLGLSVVLLRSSTSAEQPQLLTPASYDAQNL